MPAGLPGTAAEQQIPLELIPAALLNRVNGLHAQLGYPALVRGAGTTADRTR
jgi:hypothetical protein